MKYIRTKYGKILDMQNASECIYVIRNKNIESKNCYVSWLWDNWKDYFLIDCQNCMLFSYNSAQIFISDLMKENLNYQDFVIELSPYYKNCEQADTIEELCDGFYNDILNDFDCFGFDGLYIYNDFESFKEDWKAYRVHDNWEGNGYGFIKTSKGLIFVAKMNDEGELELL